MDILNKIGLYIRINENDSLQLGSPYIYKYKGKWIIDTKHSIDRRYQRVKQNKFVLTEKQIIFLFKKIIDYCLKNENKWVGLYETEILFFSKSLNQGVVITYRRDKNSNSDEKHVVIITYLPKGKSNPKPGTLKVVTESDKFKNIPVVILE